MKATAPACNGWVRTSARSCDSEVLLCLGKTSFAQNFVNPNFCCSFGPSLDHPPSAVTLCHLSSDSLSPIDKVADWFCHFNSYFSFCALFCFLIFSLWWILFRKTLFRQIGKGQFGDPQRTSKWLYTGQSAVSIQQIQDTAHVDLNRGKGLNMTAFPVLQSALLVMDVYGSKFFLHKLMKTGICAWSS